MSKTEESPEKRAADILLRGGKMLALACPVCSSPLYQTRDGEVVCVVCNRPVKIVSKEEYEKQVQKQNQESKPKTKAITSPSSKKVESKENVPVKKELTGEERDEDVDDAIMNAYDVLTNKLEEIMSRIEGEKDLSTLERLLSVAEKIMDLILLIEEEY